ncbi:MAG: nucleotidyltransferase family protein [Planctomycetota bacterium]
MRHDLHPLPRCTQLIARILRPDCSGAEAAVMLGELARTGGLERLLAFRPHHRIGPALAARIREHNIGRDEPELRALIGLLDRIAAACELRSQLLRAQLEEAVALFAERGIRVCLIKGAASLAGDAPEGYLPAGIRPMEDLDIVVGPDDGDAAFELIAERGWLCSSGAQPVQFSLDSPALVDVRAWAPRTAALGFLELDDFFARAAATSVAGREVRVLRPQKALQLRLSHNVIRQHLFVDFPLLDLYEMAGIVAACSGRIDWAGVRSVGLMNDVARIFYAILLRLRDEFGAPVPDEAIPLAEVRAAEHMWRTLGEFEAAPAWLYGAASRFVLMSTVKGRFLDKLDRMCTVLFSDPLRLTGKASPAGRICLPARMLAGHLAVCCWRLLRG